MIFLSGLAVSAGHAASDSADSAERERKAEKTESAADAPVRRVLAKTAWASKKTSVAKTPARRGVVPLPTEPVVELRDPTMTTFDAIRHATMIAEQMLRENRLGGSANKAPGSPGTGNGSGGGSGGTLIGNGSNHSEDNLLNTRNNWNGDDIPPMGEGISFCRTPEFVGHTSLGRSFATVNSISRWPILPLPVDAVDLDGDGEYDDPLPQRPVVVYYQFLEEAMTEVEWVDGEDNFNQIGLRTTDDNDSMNTMMGDDVIDSFDTPDETDGIADTWIPDGGYIARHILPPPVFDDFDEDLAIWLTASGLGTIRWGDARPNFIHPDAEAAWRLAQREYRGLNGFGFEDTFDSGQVLEPEEREFFLTAFSAIEQVANIIFIERADDAASINAGYPYAPKGYSLDPQGILVSSGTLNDGVIVGGIPEPTGDEPNVPEDDYPWILIAKGDPFGNDGGNFATTLGALRIQGFGGTALSYYGSYNDVDGSFGGVAHLVDIDRDGFPDTPDISGDGIADDVILSSLGNTPAGGAAPVLSIFDTTGDNAVDHADTSFDGAGVVQFPFEIDLDGNGLLDEAVIDPISGGVGPIASIHTLFVDVGGDGVADSLMGGAVPSLSPHALPNVPCELLNMNVEVVEDGGIGVMVHEIMHHLGFAHEHQRPDREEFVTVNYNNLGAGTADQFSVLPSGSGLYTNWINNFDVTPTDPDPTNNPPTVAPAEWTITGNATSGAFIVADPVGGDLGPDDDYNFDPLSTGTDHPLAVMAAVTGNAGSEELDGTTILTSPTIYGPKDATIEFAYWLNSDSSATLPTTDGLYVQTSNDAGATWSTVMAIREPAAEWRTASVTVGDDRNDSDDRDPSFLVRFLARDIGADDVVEIAVDYVRVQNPYDFYSIMHYGPFSGTVSGFPLPGFETITVDEPFTEEFSNAIGNNNGLSRGDRLALRNLYGDAPTPDDLVGPNDPCRADVNEDGFIDGFDIALFLEWYNAKDPRADFAAPECVDTDGDNDVDLDDDTSECINALDLVQFFIDLQFSFACLPGLPDNGLGGNNFEEVNPG